MPSYFFKVLPLFFLHKFVSNYLLDQSSLFMAFGNTIKHKVQKVFDNWFDMLSVERKPSDYHMEFS